MISTGSVAVWRRGLAVSRQWITRIGQAGKTTSTGQSEGSTIRGHGITFIGILKRIRQYVHKRPVQSLKSLDYNFISNKIKTKEKLHLGR